MKIKNVISKDLKEMYALEKEVFKENAFSKRIIFKLFKNNLIFLKLEKRKKIKKEIIGFIIVVKDQANRANIVSILIKPSYQHQGYGEILIKKTIEIIRGYEEINSIILNVGIKNYNAIKLYKKFNFIIIKEIEKYYNNKENAYLMELNLKKKLL
ncbi:MAG: GNAT family N-acetyltransferase [Promethearchaeota archaeon]